MLLRLKEDYDGAEPAASSVAVLNLLVLSHLGAPRDDRMPQIERTLRLFAPRLTQAPRAVPMMLAALSAWHAGLAEVVIVGPRGEHETAALRTRVDGSYQPFVGGRRRCEPAGAQRAALERLAPWLGGHGHERRAADRVRLPRLRLRGADDRARGSFAATRSVRGVSGGDDLHLARVREHSARAPTSNRM